jgi:hypothetical protein
MAKRMRPYQRSAIDLDQMGDDEPLEAVHKQRVSGYSGAWQKLHARLEKLAPGKGFRLPLQQANMDPERAARTVRSAVRVWTKKHELPAAAYGVWALTSGVFVWRAAADLNPGIAQGTK